MATKKSTSTKTGLSASDITKVEEALAEIYANRQSAFAVADGCAQVWQVVAGKQSYADQPWADCVGELS